MDETEMNHRSELAVRPGRLIQIAVICLFFISGALAQIDGPSGQVLGTVFVMDSQGRSYVPGAKVMLSGPASLEQQQTNAQGQFKFEQIPPGVYTVTVQSSGMEVAQSVTVEAGKVAEAELELKLAEVKTSVTVSDTAPEISTAAPVQTVSSATVQNAPNQNDRTESVLPLVPGVVRGPDGRINLKGSSTAQTRQTLPPEAPAWKYQSM
jgi:Carboxypeptidase regulatory-like domain